MIPKETIANVRAAHDIVDVINRHVPLKRAGSNFIAICPFHRERTPSFNVNPHRQAFKCFGCGKGGDVIDFIREIDGLEFTEAVTRLAEAAKIPIAEETETDKSANSFRSVLMEINERYSNMWNKSLDAWVVGRQFLAERMIPPNRAQQFQIGYCKDNTFCYSPGGLAYPDHLLVAAGVLQQGLDATRPERMRFAGRVVFPIHDDQGRVRGFSGRSTDPAVQPKYVNTPQTAVFEKGKLLYGLHLAKRAIADHEFALVVEGPIDVIRCHCAGICGTVAPMGTALTPDQVRLLKRYTNTVILCFDADKAGQGAAARAVEHLIAARMEIRVVTMPDGMDPDSYILEHGGEKFLERVRFATPFYQFYWALLESKHDSRKPEGRSKMVTAMAELLIPAKDQVILESVVQFMAGKLGLSVNSVWVQFQSCTVRGRRSPEVDESGQPVQPSPVSLSEMWLLKLVCHDDQLAKWVWAHWSPDWVQSSDLRTLIHQRIVALNMHGKGVRDLMVDIEHGPRRDLLIEAVVEPLDSVDPELMLKGDSYRTGVLQSVRDAYISHRLEELGQLLADGRLKYPDTVKIEAEKKELRSLRSQPIQP